jgi:predicted AAA+ superfamily ATPase
MAVNKIGTRRESSLHRILKFRYAGADGQTEVNAGAYVADGISAEGEFIEVQTGSFAPLKQKAQELAFRGGLRIIHPVIVAKYIEVLDKRGQTLYRRKSPRRGSPWDLFDALVYAPELPLIPGLRIELALVDVVEKRISDGKGSWRRKGLSILSRELSAWHEGITLQSPKDYLRFVPFKRGEEFTTSLLAKKAGIPVHTAQKTLNTLYKMKLVERIGKKGNTLVYKRKARYSRVEPGGYPPVIPNSR